MFSIKATSSAVSSFIIIHGIFSKPIFLAALNRRSPETTSNLSILKQINSNDSNDDILYENINNLVDNYTTHSIDI